MLEESTAIVTRKSVTDNTYPRARKWTAEAEAILRKCVADGKDSRTAILELAEIGFHVSRNAAIGKAIRLGARFSQTTYNYGPRSKAMREVHGPVDQPQPSNSKHADDFADIVEPKPVTVPPKIPNWNVKSKG
jgi:hypothetical protein